MSTDAKAHAAQRSRTTTRERAAAEKQRKLDRMAEQVREGTLVIRQMTAEERAKWPPPSSVQVAAAKKRRGRKRSLGSQRVDSQSR